MIDSVTYWAKEYHIDGFRFDLMGLHDVETLNQVRESIIYLRNILCSDAVSLPQPEPFENVTSSFIL